MNEETCELCDKEPEPPKEKPRAERITPYRGGYTDDDEYPAGYRKPAPRPYEPDEGEWYRDRL